MPEKTKITSQQKVAIGILAVIGLIMFYTKVYAPMENKINESGQLLEKKAAELIDMRKKAQKLNELEAEFKVLGEQLKLAEKKLPLTRELPEIIRIITETATKYGMNVDNLRVSAPESAQYYIAHDYKLQLISDYHTFGRFFTEIVQLDRIFNIMNVIFSPVKSKEETDGELSASFSIVAYTSK